MVALDMSQRLGLHVTAASPILLRTELSKSNLVGYLNCLARLLVQRTEYALGLASLTIDVDRTAVCQVL